MSTSINYLKKSTFTLCFALCSLLLTCSSSDDGSGSGEFITASVDGSSYRTSNFPEAVSAAKIEGQDDTSYIVQGFDNNANAIVLFIVGYAGPGTYDISYSSTNNGTNGQFTNTEASWTSNNLGGSGTITVKEDESNETSGTFEFVGVAEDGSERTVSNGRFRAFYDSQ